MFRLYELLLYLAFMLAFPWFLITGVPRGKYLSNFGPRFGFYKGNPSRHDLWVHAVSVGEVLAARPILQRVLEARPDTTVVVTTTTISGQTLARSLFPSATVTYFPFDFSFAVRSFLHRYSPSTFAIMETEIWPNVSRLAAQRGVRMLLANGRISDRSLRHYRPFRHLLSRVLSSYSVILARDPVDRERFIAIGAPADHVEVSGNVKFDLERQPRPLAIRPELERLIAGRKVFVAGSTVEGEDELLIVELPALIRELECFVVLAPRKPERFELVAGLLAASTIPFIRRSELEMTGRPEGRKHDLLLLDSIGELAAIYELASAAFVGGSLVSSGGHNPIEPAAAGVPVCFGPHMTNFREIAASFVQEEAAVEVGGLEELVGFVRRMLTDEEVNRSISQRAKRTVERNRGAADLTARRILELLP
ncbi:MAG TPA: 3-deoxy-D-manno-octulosonic acid transferase [Thermoanaerobaculia bacterium]|nr:3-deoxy-D-manno-octulosonic acid transferase [Thermoanaerobaculia bacterium]